MVATWTCTDGTESKTITDVSIGEPLILIHHIKDAGDTGTGWCQVRFDSGVRNIKVSNNSWYYLGTVDVNRVKNTENWVYAAAGVASIVLIPTATSVTVTFYQTQTNDEIYVYQ